MYLPPSDPTQVKLQRAKNHIDTLNDAIDTFVKAESYTIGRYHNSDRTEYYWITRTSRPFPLWWSTVVGDCLHNLRSSLDHLAFALANRPSGPEGEQIQFPIMVDPPQGGFDNAVKSRLWCVPPKALAVIERLQPYRQVNFVPHPLAALNRWSNADKHRVVHPIWGAVSEGTFRASSIPVECGPLQPVFENHTPIFWARFDAPEMNVDYEPHIQVVLQIDRPKGVLPLPYLAWIHRFIEEHVVPPLVPFLPQP